MVDLQKILETSNSGKAAQNELKVQRDKMQADMKQRGNEIQEIESRMQREAMVMSKETREEKEREHRIKVSDFQALQRKYQSDLQEIERKLMDYAARERGLDGVICGHIHWATMRDIDGLTYINCGDWVESGTALVEHRDGTLELTGPRAMTSSRSSPSTSSCPRPQSS